jgi:CheY-like chemotaxis protein
VSSIGPQRRSVILLVEDEPAVRELAASVLRERGLDVLAFGAAEPALVVLDDPSLDVSVLVTDLHLPGMDGATFASCVRAIHPRVRVLITSGSGEEGILDRLGESREAQVLVKPYRLADLARAVERAREV